MMDCLCSSDKKDVQDRLEELSKQEEEEVQPYRARLKQLRHKVASKKAAAEGGGGKGRGRGRGRGRAGGIAQGSSARSLPRLPDDGDIGADICQLLLPDGCVVMKRFLNLRTLVYYRRSWSCNRLWQLHGGREAMIICLRGAWSHSELMLGGDGCAIAGPLVTAGHPG